MPRKQALGSSLTHAASRLRIWIMMMVVGTAQDAIAQNTLNSRNVVSKSMDFEHRKPMVYGNAQRAIGTGMHIKNIYQINLRNQSFWAEGWYWIKWGPEVQNIIASEKIPLDRVLEFTNEIEVNNSVIEPESAEPVELKDGRFYQDFRFSAHFFVNDLNLSRFPFYEIICQSSWKPGRRLFPATREVSPALLFFPKQTHPKR